MYSRPHPHTAIPVMICLVVLGLCAVAFGYHEPLSASETPIVERDADSSSFTLAGLSFAASHGASLVADEPKESEKPKTDKPSSDQAYSMQQHDEVWMLKKRIIELQNKGKLGFRKVVPCSSVERYGIYSPIEARLNSPNLVLYVEPANYSTMVTQDRYIIDCTVDLILVNPSGKVLGGKKGILKINRISRSPILDLFYKIQINAKKPLKQGFILKTVLHDKIKNQSTAASFRINVQPGGKNALDPI